MCLVSSLCALITCNVYPGSQVNATTSLTIYLSPVLIPLAGIIGSGQVVRPTARQKKKGKVKLFEHMRVKCNINLMKN